MTDKVAPAELQNTPLKPEENHINLKKQLGLLDGIGIIVGIIIGSGIFLSPRGVVLYAGSVGLSLILWVSAGLLSLIGALCYAELGTMIPRSGGDYAYLTDAFGPLPAFLYLWVSLFILVPAGNAVTAITFATYILQPLWPCGPPPYDAIRLLAAAAICFLTAINCHRVKWATRVMDAFTLTKIFALTIIIGAGFYWMGAVNTDNLAQPMANTATDPGKIVFAVYSGLFSYSGWNYLNFVTEELKDPYRNLPKAICISLPLITIIFVLANLAYFVILTKEEILLSDAVAVTFGNKFLGPMSWIMPLFVACATFGSLNGAIFASSRLFFVGARNGHLPNAIAMINIENLTPTPSLVFLCVITLAMLTVDNVFELINSVSFIEAIFTALSVTGLLWLRYQKPDLHRPIKVSLVFPVLFLVMCAILVICPCLISPWNIAVGLVIIIAGIPVYFVFIYWKNKPQWLVNTSHVINTTCAKLFMCIPEEKDD